jgi:hypothetical protein
MQRLHDLERAPRILGASDEPLIILKGQSLELREAGGQVVVIQRDTPRDAPAPPDPHEDSDTDFTDGGLRLATRS